MLGLQYDTEASTIEDFTKAVRDMLTTREAVDGDSVVVLFTEYDDSSLNLLVRCYVDLEDWTAAKAERHAVNLEIARIAADMDVGMAFPSRSLYVESLPAGLVGQSQQVHQANNEATAASTPNGNQQQSHPREYRDSDGDYEVEDYTEGAQHSDDAGDE